MFRADGPVMRGKTVIVTGANTGIGFCTASELARYGARVILACRNLERAENARKLMVDELKKLPDQADVEQRVVVKQLDLSSLKSVRAFAEDILKSESRLDVLINNAAVAGYKTRTLTEDGLEVTMATNHFGHFLLTNLLLPLLKSSAPSRIIVVSSWAHTFEKSFDLENLNSEKGFSELRVYNVTKVANIMFTRHLAKQLEGTNVIVNAVHPGFVSTELYRELKGIGRFLLKPILATMALSPSKGAQTSVFLAASQAPGALVNGRYFYKMKEDSVSSVAANDEAAARLWEISAKLTGLSTSQ